MNMKLFNISLALATVIGLGFTGCGDDTESADSGKSIEFPSSSKKAKPTLENGKEVEKVVASDDIVGLPIPNGLSNSNALSSTSIVVKSANIIQKQVKDNSEYGIAYTEDVSTVNCSNGGTVKTSLSGSLTSTSATYTTIYSQCNDGSNTLNGEISYSASILDYANDTLDSMHVYFVTNFSMHDISSNKSAEIKEGSNFTIQTVGNKLKIKISLQATEGSNYYGQENAIYYMYDNASISYVYQTQGRIYIDNLEKYVDYDTSYDMSQTPFAYNESGSITSGEARYIMSNNGRVKIVVEDTDNVKTYVDADGDGSFELSE